MRILALIFGLHATVICPCEPIFSVNSLDSHGHITVTPTSIAMLGTADNGLSSAEADGKLTLALRLLKPLLFIKFSLRIRIILSQSLPRCGKSVFRGAFSLLNWQFLPLLVYHIISAICCQKQKFHYCLSNFSVQFHTVFT